MALGKVSLVSPDLVAAVRLTSSQRRRNERPGFKPPLSEHSEHLSGRSGHTVSLVPRNITNPNPRDLRDNQIQRE